EEEQEEVVEEQPTETETSGKTHIVQPNETLYRIAMNYYNSPDAVQKIKDANGLTSDSISEGQKLILP
ncbi:MAG: LysM peptidoglycan-binding domain-containing protein, partial [Planococcaceae bacterium]|nr:LysM peptidoglycan-binding domain-containing protein [Planococcaceae bacterium]